MAKKENPKFIFNSFVNKLANDKKAIDEERWLRELPKHRDWEVALNVLHLALKAKPYYAGIATNTRRKINGIFEGITFEYMKENISYELKTLLKMRMNTLDDLNKKIKEKQITLHQDRDIWCFTTTWREFAEGTKVIAIHQEITKHFLSNKQQYRRGFIILDKKCPVTSQNRILLIIKKVFEDEKNIERILKMAAKEFINHPVRKIKPPKYIGRMPGRLVMLLRNQFELTIINITEEEKNMLLSYFSMLRRMGDFSDDHKDLEIRIKKFFKQDLNKD